MIFTWFTAYCASVCLRIGTLSGFVPSHADALGREDLQVTLVTTSLSAMGSNETPSKVPRVARLSPCLGVQFNVAPVVDALMVATASLSKEPRKTPSNLKIQPVNAFDAIARCSTIDISLKLSSMANLSLWLKRIHLLAKLTFTLHAWLFLTLLKNMSNRFNSNSTWQMVVQDVTTLMVQQPLNNVAERHT